MSNVGCRWLAPSVMCMWKTGFHLSQHKSAPIFCSLFACISTYVPYSSVCSDNTNIESFDHWRGPCVVTRTRPAACLLWYLHIRSPDASEIDCAFCSRWKAIVVYRVPDRTARKVQKQLLVSREDSLFKVLRIARQVLQPTYHIMHVLAQCSKIDLRSVRVMCEDFDRNVIRQELFN